MNSLQNLVDKIKSYGIIKTTKLIWQIPYFYLYKFRFKKCRKIYITGEFQIRGHQNIQIETFSAGSRIRIDAISGFLNQKFSPEIIIGNNFICNNDIHIACTSHIEIGDNVLFGSNVYLSDHDHGIYSNSDLEHSSPMEKPSTRLLNNTSFINIGDNVFIGEYVTILKNVNIGEGSIIGAHSLITKDVPAYSIVAGNPARVIKKYDFNTGFWLKI